MTIQITSKIVGYEVVSAEAAAAAKAAEQAVQLPAEPDYEEMHEKVKRQEHRVGSTYKIKTHTSEPP